MRYFTSDQHFFDHGIISYCDRPYKAIYSMNDEIIKRFTEKTKDADDIYILGDILGYNRPVSEIEALAEVMEKLGIKRRPFHLIIGNHDTLSEEQYLKIGFSTVSRLSFIEIDGRKVMLTHDPCMVQPMNTIAICGHIHTLFSENWQPLRKTLTVNACVEVRNYAPFSEQDFIDIVSSYNI